VAEQERTTAQTDVRRITIPHFWGWFAFAIIAAILALFTFAWPFILPKSILIGIAVFCLLWWLLGGLFFRARFARSIRGKQRRSGLRIGGWALDGWHARHARHGSYWRAMRNWIK
jgi:hypothetical protein